MNKIYVNPLRVVEYNKIDEDNKLIQTFSCNLLPTYLLNL